ncbi:MAG: thioester domain-containing protein [Sciscionella sp.]|nr:thioester domain-containing protein [Sciscionella sp.]
MMKTRLLRAGIGASIIGASVAIAVAMLPANADPATGTVDPAQDQDGLVVNMAGEGHVPTVLFGLKLNNGNDLHTYCVELTTSQDPKHPNMTEVPWNAYPNASSAFNKNRDKINWVLHNSYPDVQDLAALSAKTHRPLTAQEAIAGTQAAIWHYSDGATLQRNAVPSGGGKSADVYALYRYLTGKDNVGIPDEPPAALSISPESQTGKSGDKIGPFIVSTTAKSIDLTSKFPAGVTLVDENGKNVKSSDIANGTKIYFKVPANSADGDGSFTLNANATVDTGRLFIGSDNKDHPTQSQIVATANETSLSATGKAHWTAAPVSTTTGTPTSPPTTTSAAPTSVSSAPVAPTAPRTTPSTTAPSTPAVANASNNSNLPNTGASILGPTVLGIALVFGGGLLVFLQRRRRGGRV